MRSRSFLIPFVLLLSLALELSASGEVYWTSTGTIRRANLDGTGETDLGIVIQAFTPLFIDEAGGMIYWASNATGTIHRANLDGTGETDLGNIATREITLDPAGGKMYWPSDVTNTIHCANLDGTREKDLATTHVEGNTAIFLDPAGGKMYWSGEGNAPGGSEEFQIHRADLLCSTGGPFGEENLGVHVAGISFIALDPAGGKMYFGSPSGSLRRANLDGSGETDLLLNVIDQGNELYLDTVGGKIYWAAESNNLQSANLDGSPGGAFLCANAVNGGRQLAIDVAGGNAYWSMGGSLNRVSLDPNCNTDLGLPMEQPFAVIFEEPAMAISLPALGGWALTVAAAFLA